MARIPAAEPRIRLLTIFMLTPKLLCREGSGSAGCNTLRLVPLSLKTRLAASRLRTLPLNARDLSEPPNGTTSGCPPPSQHHNYRRLLHTQQRNRSERGESGRFWKGVAQITRSRDRAFIASLCSLMLFSISSIWRADRCAGSGLARFSPSRISVRPESSDRGDHPLQK